MQKLLKNLKKEEARKKREGDNKNSKSINRVSEVDNLSGNVDVYGRVEIKQRSYSQSDNTVEPSRNIKGQAFCEKLSLFSLIEFATERHSTVPFITLVISETSRSTCEGMLNIECHFFVI